MVSCIWALLTMLALGSPVCECFCGELHVDPVMMPVLNSPASEWLLWRAAFGHC